MAVESKNLSSGLEDYLETIYLAHKNNTPLKGAELARLMNISRASVSEALSKLVSKELINYSSYEAISITSTGIEEAEKIYKKHNILEQFFGDVLGIEKNEASENACKIEHIISEKVFDEISRFTYFCKENKNFIEKYKKEKTK